MHQLKPIIMKQQCDTWKGDIIKHINKALNFFEITIILTLVVSSDKSSDAKGHVAGTVGVILNIR